MNHLSRLLVALSTATILAAAANATQTVTYTSYIGAQPTEFSGSDSLQAFNTALGTLTGVAITYDISADMVGSVKSTAAGTNNFDFSELVSAYYTFSGSYVANNKKVQAVGEQFYSGFVSGQQASFGEFTYNDTDAFATISLSSNLAAFTTSALNYSMFTITGQSVQGGGGNMTAAIATTGKGYVSIAYTYTEAAAAVPEPASWAMMVGGFGVLGGALRRTRSKAVAVFG